MIKRHHIQDSISRGLLIRNIVFFYFVVLLLVGLVLLVSSVWVIAQMLNDCEDIDKSRPPAFVTLTSGILLVLMSMLGALLVRRGSSQHFVRIYSSVLTLVWVLNISAIVLSAILSQQMGLNTRWSEDFLNHLLLYPSQGTSRKCMDNIQRVFYCCGVNNYTEWSRVNISSLNNPDALFPETCACTNTRASCETVMTGGGTANIYSSPCLPKMQGFLSVHLTVILAIASVECFIQMATTLCLLCTVNKVQNSSVIGSYIVQSTRSESQVEIHGAVISCQSSNISIAHGSLQAATRNQSQNQNAAEPNVRNNSCS